MPKDFRDIAYIISDIECKPYVFQFRCSEAVRGLGGCGDIDPLSDPCTNPQHHWILQATLWRKDTDTGVEGWGYGGKYFLSPHMTQGEIVKKCFVAARDYAEHEVRETFTWRGRKILGPHIDINGLWEVAGDLEVRESNDASQ